MTEITIQEIMDGMPGAFLPEKAAGVNAVIQFRFTGAEAGEWFMTIREGVCSVQPGTNSKPKLTVIADSQDFKDLVDGKLDGMSAAMQGRIKLIGDITLTMKLLSFFKN
jgi:putative sterol carrier protein